jgi:hypothetical protein
LGHFPPDLLVEMDRLRYPCIMHIVLDDYEPSCHYQIPEINQKLKVK